MTSRRLIAAPRLNVRSNADIACSTRYVRFGSFGVLPDFFYRSLNFFCRLVETFAPTSRQSLSGDGNTISWQLWPGRSNHGSAPLD